MIRRQFSNDDVAAALAAADGDGNKAAAALGCSSYVIARYRREAGITVPTSVPVRWTTENLRRLREANQRSTRPTSEALAAEFGTSVAAVQTAMSRFGITKSPLRAASGKPAPLADYRRRDCMCCETPFLSEGKHNRLCTECASGRRVAA